MIYETLKKVQAELKAPKNLYNSFGKYKYRNAEGICEAVKPYETKYNFCLILSDKILQVGDRYYVEATATMIDCGDGSQHSVTALAREADEKKGMDESQLTGTASSYARKYALNGLFLLDDTKDADTDEYHNQTSGKPAKDSVMEDIKARTEIMKLCNEHNINAEKLAAKYGHKNLGELSPEENAKCLEYIKKHLPKEGKNA